MCFLRFKGIFVIFIVNFIILCNSEILSDAGRLSAESRSFKSSQVDNVVGGTKFTVVLKARIGQPPPDCATDSGVWQTESTGSPREPLTTPDPATKPLAPSIKIIASPPDPLHIKTLGPPPDSPLNHLEYLEDRVDKVLPDEAILKQEHAKLILEINQLMEINTITPDFIHEQQLVYENRLKRGEHEVYLADESKDESFFVEDLQIHPTSARPHASVNISPVRIPYSTIDHKKVMVMTPVHPLRPRHPYPFERPLSPGHRPGPETSTTASSLRPVDNRYVKPKNPYLVNSPSLWQRFISLFPRLVY